jgi:hypothetical protein
VKELKHHLYILLLIVFPATLFSQSDRVIVTVAKADVYAEPSSYSYRIDTVTRGTVLALFQKTKVNDSWYYVRFQSQRYGGPAMGFVKDTDVEPYAGETKEAAPPPLPQAEKKPPRETKEKPVPEKKQVIPVPEKKAEVKPSPITSEEVSIETAPPGHLRLDPALAEAADSFPERLWVRTALGTAPTPIPSYRPVRAPAPQSLLESRVYEVVQPPPPKEEARRPAEKPPVEPPFVKRAQPVRPPAETGPVLSTTAFSDKVTLSKGPDSFEVRLDFSPFSSFRSFEIPDPVRMVVDFQDVEESAGFHRYAVNDLGVTAIRVAMFQDNIARVVFDFRREIPAYQIEQTEGGIKILFWLAETAQPQAVKPETQPIQPPEKEIEPEPEPVISTEEALQATAIPFSSRFTLAEPIYPRRERMFLWIEGETVETMIPRRTIANLPAYYPPTQETFWEVIRTEPVKAEPKPKAKPLDIPPPQAELVTKSPPVEAKEEDTETKDQVIKPPEQIRPPTQAPYTQPQVTLPARLSLGMGYGSSTGGFGGFVQYSVLPNLALHGGVGYYPASLIYSETDWVENQVLYSFGLKYYIPIVSQSVRGYLNIQYGGFTVEAVQVIEGIWEYEFIYRNEQRALFGPQALLGGEFHLGPLKLNAAVGAAYALTDWEWLPQDFYFTFDLGFLFYLK